MTDGFKTQGGRGLAKTMQALAEAVKNSNRVTKKKARK